MTEEPAGQPTAPMPTTAELLKNFLHSKREEAAAQATPGGPQ